ncbi:2-polyprenyl-6-methoxyphenol hydroxylase [Pedobacter steynii]|uniref:2-polyprenyl-6-methoxyphenol hydroxylase n=1 Tax=Pedobacter steynii TaxID=430522 RepID=A0A1G9RIF7_9SPHI|nr:NAD(P)/FAD-dependent oxidoreductase [Pedobacter steynii]NQX37744.1 FAD-dependent monooxygenase [Pedobacter steynii]SDM23102.1 2-polyprenyl-6-methoxyphenol hydroxylase [Pedobacter steynii]
MKVETNKEVDIAIIGGGVAGCTAAIALAGSYNVVLIDQTDNPPKRIGECLPPATRRILKQLDLLDGLDSPLLSGNQSKHLKHIGTQSYWGNEQAHIVDLLRNPDGFGWHLDRQAFEIYLREAALKRGVNCFWPAKLQSAHFENHRWSITAVAKDKASNDTPYHFKAKFVIDASGRQSQFARKIGIGRQQYDKLISCWLMLPNQEANKMSTISATEIGWWYSSPLPQNKRILALQTDPDLIDRNVLKDVNQFFKLAQSNREMANVIPGDCSEFGFHQTVAANSTRLNQVAGQQWVALGDAAMSFDPLSSQGMFNAMANAVQLTELMIKSDPTGILKPESLKEIQTGYTDQLDRIWAYYTQHKRMYYREEMRWKDAPFWKRRH